MRTVLINVLITSLLIFAFDLTMFWFLSPEYTLRFEAYRRNPTPTVGAPTVIVGGRGLYPQDYFVQHSVRGFDQGRNKKGQHWVQGIMYPIWTNSIACFDNEHPHYDKYVYFAGDSQVWGYAHFEDKFGTVIERMTGTPILKCGVTHTGQRHQYEKLVEVTKQIGKLPKAIFV